MKLLLFSRYPNKIDPTRFKRSEIYDPSGKYSKDEDNSNRDAYTIKDRKEKEQMEIYSKDVTEF